MYKYNIIIQTITEQNEQQLPSILHTIFSDTKDKLKNFIYRNKDKQIHPNILVNKYIT